MMNDLKIIKKNINKRIEHKNWEYALTLAYTHISLADPGEVVTITGPSRGGKTELTDNIVNLLNGSNENRIAIKVTAGNESKNGSFSTKTFTFDLLEEIKHPIFSSSNPLYDKENSRRARIPETELKRAFVNAVKCLGIKFLFIDEAQHVKWVTKDAKAPEAVLDSWKVLAEKAGLILIIVGAYPVLEFIRRSAHIEGRAYKVDLARYKKNNNEDLKEFVAILDIYDLALGSYRPSKGLSQYAEDIYNSTLGCIGLVRNLLLTAVSNAFVRNQRIDGEIIKLACKTDEELRVIKEEISLESEFRHNQHKPSQSNQRNVKDNNRSKKNKPFQKNAKRYSLRGRS